MPLFQYSISQFNVNEPLRYKQDSAEYPQNKCQRILSYKVSALYGDLRTVNLSGWESPLNLKSSLLTLIGAYLFGGGRPCSKINGILSIITLKEGLSVQDLDYPYSCCNVRDLINS